MTIEDLQNKLNEEYKHIWTITITEMSPETLDISKIEYVKSIIGDIEPLDIDEPIVVSKDWNTYSVIDGYHRLKSKLQKWEQFINCIVLSNYKINRKHDTLFDFLKELIGEEIEFRESTIMFVGGNCYFIQENEWCGWCSNLWYSITVSPEFIGKKIKINSIESDNRWDGESDIYDLVINGKKIAEVDTWWWNWYYGGDFKVKVLP